MEVIHYLNELHFSNPSTLNKLPSSPGWGGSKWCMARLSDFLCPLHSLHSSPSELLIFLLRSQFCFFHSFLNPDQWLAPPPRLCPSRPVPAQWTAVISRPAMRTLCWAVVLPAQFALSDKYYVTSSHFSDAVLARLEMIIYLTSQQEAFASMTHNLVFLKIVNISYCFY